MQDVREGRYPTDMDGFLYVIADARQSLESVINTQSADDLTERRDPQGWAIKDHLYHLAVWERGIRYLLQGKPRHEGMELTETDFEELDVDAMNEVTFRKNRDRPLSEVIQVFHEEHRAMIDFLQSDEISWDDLQKPYSEYASHGQEADDSDPVLYWVFGNTAAHFDMHQTWIEEILRED
jgi:uncharacterized damage-inducible protein DinB